MVRIKGWKKWSKGWSGKGGNTITLTQRQDRDGRNAFLYGAKIRNDKSLGTGRKTKTLFKEVRNEKLLRKKVSSFIRKHPKG